MSDRQTRGKRRPLHGNDAPTTRRRGTRKRRRTRRRRRRRRRIDAKTKGNAAVAGVGLNGVRRGFSWFRSIWRFFFVCVGGWLNFHPVPVRRSFNVSKKEYGGWIANWHGTRLELYRVNRFAAFTGFAARKNIGLQRQTNREERKMDGLLENNWCI